MKKKGWLYHWRYGRHDHFPVCCVIMFILKMPRTMKYARRNGVRYTPAGEHYVPCGIFHRPHRSCEDHFRAGLIGRNVIELHANWAIVEE